jgi:hypothetical protein
MSNSPLGSDQDSRNPARGLLAEYCPYCDNGEVHSGSECCGYEVQNGICIRCLEHAEEEWEECVFCKGTGVKL